MQEPIFDHERLDVYRLSIDYVASSYKAAKSLKGTERHARDQWLRAAQSIPLNIAEGNGKQSPKDKRRFFEIARGSALECAAIHDVMSSFEAIDSDLNRSSKTILKRIVSMMTRLIQHCESVSEQSNEYEYRDAEYEYEHTDEKKERLDVYRLSKIHPTAMIEENVQIGAGTSVWDHAHIRHDTVIGEQCIVGGKSTIAYGVRIGNRCKINSSVYICTEVTIEDGVMISAGTIFTNDRFPRATTPDLKSLRSSDPDEFTEKTLVREGATIGAGCIIGSNLEIGRWAMIGMGAIVTKSVPDFHLCIGSPARSLGAVCRCGQLLTMFSDDQPEEESHTCSSCSRVYNRTGKTITELSSQ